MGLMEFLILCIIVVCISMLAIYLLGALAPGHPPIIDKIIWIVAVVIIVMALVRAMGLMNYDPQIPRLK